MNFNEIRTMAKDLGINTYRKKKTELIHTIQEAEDNIVCYGTEMVEYCNEITSDSRIIKEVFCYVFI